MSASLQQERDECLFQLLKAPKYKRATPHSAVTIEMPPKEATHGSQEQ